MVMIYKAFSFFFFSFHFIFDDAIISLVIHLQIFKNMFGGEVNHFLGSAMHLIIIINQQSRVKL